MKKYRTLTLEIGKRLPRKLKKAFKKHLIDYVYVNYIPIITKESNK